MSLAPWRTMLSISRGVTNMPLILPSPRKPASMTVGIPIEITGRPRVARLSSRLSLPTPEPGEIPAFETCTLRQRDSASEPASASITTTTSGDILRHRVSICAADSMPDVPSTPGLQSAREQNCGKLSSSACFKCRVTSIFEAARDPSASGVMSGLPRAATKTFSCSFGRHRVISDASALTASGKRSLPRSNQRGKDRV